MVKIRKYREKDRNYVREICKATAADTFKKSTARLEAVPLIYCDYFLDCEYEKVFVAVNESDIPIGYILCAEKENFAETLKKIYIKKARFMCKVYLLYGYAYLLNYQALPKEFRTHLHIDILPEYQGQKIGTKLIEELKQELKKNGKSNLSVCGISKKSSAFSFYKKCGFKTLKNHGFGVVSLYTEY